MLELKGLGVALRRRGSRPRPLARGGPRRDRRPDRTERCRQVDDAPRDHGADPTPARERSWCRDDRCGAVRRSGSRRPVWRSSRRDGGSSRSSASRRTCSSASPAAERRSGAAEDIAAVHELFPIVREFRRRPAGVLSGGQQQQLAIARALVAAPDLLLLDEPSLGLSPTMVDVVFEALRTIRDRGLTVLLVEQRAQRTVALADRSYVLANGELRLTLTPADAGDTEKMVAAYLS